MEDGAPREVAIPSCGALVAKVEFQGRSGCPNPKRRNAELDPSSAIEAAAVFNLDGDVRGVTDETTADTGQETRKGCEPRFVRNESLGGTPPQEASIGEETENGPNGDAQGEPKVAVKRLFRWPETIMAIFTALIFVVGVLSYFTSRAQWAVMNGQLQEMKNSSEDTQNLVSASEDQANAMNSLASAGNAQAESTNAVADESRNQLDAIQGTANATRTEADAAQTLAKTTRDSMVTANRAWVLAVGVQLDGPLADEKPLLASVLIQNAGKSPAVNVNNHSGYAQIPTADLDAARRDKRALPNIGGDMCSHVLSGEGNMTLVPADGPQLMSVAFDPPVVDKVFLQGTIAVYIKGCLTYETLGERHVSEYCYWLGNHIDGSTGLRKWQPCPGGFKER